MTRAWADQTLLERMVTAVERVRDRLERATAALEAAAVPYAVVGGNAVAAWVATVDPAAVRNTPDVDLLLRKVDLDAATRGLGASGFVRCEAADGPLFLDGPTGGRREAVHVCFAGEKVRPHYLTASPDVSDSVEAQRFRLISLDAVVRMKLTSNRSRDQVHLRDLLGVGLIDATWPARFPAELAGRLQLLIDTPEG